MFTDPWRGFRMMNEGLKCKELLCQGDQGTQKPEHSASVFTVTAEVACGVNS